MTTTREANLAGASDEEQIAYALAAGRVIFTSDSDYLRINALGRAHAGIAYCRHGTRSLGEIIEGLALIWEVYDPEEVAGRIEYI